MDHSDHGRRDRFWLGLILGLLLGISLGYGFEHQELQRQLDRFTSVCTCP